MNWIKEKERLQDMIINKDLSYEEIGRIYDVTGAAVKKAAQRMCIPLKQRRAINPSETFNAKPQNWGVCENCGKKFHMYYKGKRFCSCKCSGEYLKKKSIKMWKDGRKSGTMAFTHSEFVRNYMMEKYHKKCQVYGWGEINHFTKKVPLQLHHIDGDPANNNEDNLQLLCPNCHALTDNFGSRGTGLVGRSKYYGKAK